MFHYIVTHSLVTLMRIERTSHKRPLYRFSLKFSESTFTKHCKSTLEYNTKRILKKPYRCLQSIKTLSNPQSERERRFLCERLISREHCNVERYLLLQSGGDVA
jgi:hypothetical protein